MPLLAFKSFEAAPNNALALISELVRLMSPAVALRILLALPAMVDFAFTLELFLIAMLPAVRLFEASPVKAVALIEELSRMMLKGSRMLLAAPNNASALISELARLMSPAVALRVLLALPAMVDFAFTLELFLIAMLPAVRLLVASPNKVEALTEAPESRIISLSASRLFIASPLIKALASIKAFWLKAMF